MNPIAAAFSRIFDRPGRETKDAHVSGVSWVGSPDTRQVIHLAPAGAHPDAPLLTREIAFATSAYCFAAMMFRATRVAEPPLMVVRETEDGEEWLPRHRLVPLFDTPRPDLMMGEILAQTVLYRDGSGGALWVLDRNLLGSLGAITPYSAMQFRVRPDKGLIFGAYEIQIQGQGWRPIERERLIHFRESNPLSWNTPLSRLEVALAALDLGHHVNRMVRTFILNGLFQGGIVSPDAEWHPTPEEWEVFKTGVEAWSRGPAAAGKPLAVPGGTTVTGTAPNLSSLLPTDILDRIEATVGSVFGIPPVVLGWQVGLENSPWSQMAEARRQTYEDTIVPLWTDIEARLTRALLSPEERLRGELVRFDTRRVVALRDDDERQARIASLNEGIWTINERRIATGQEPLPEDDERGNVIGPLPLQIAGVPSQEGEGGEGQGSEGKGNPPPEHLIWTHFDLNTKAGEPAWERAVLAHLQGELSQILAAVKAAGGDLSDEILIGRLRQILADNRPRLVAKLNPLLVGTGKQAVTALAGRLGLSFSVLEPGLLAFAQEEARFLAGVMGKTTGEAVAKAVTEGLAEGETIAQLTTRLSGLPAFDRTRAKLVARTETTRAWNGAQRRSLDEYSRESGRTVTKTWLSARDDRVRDEHIALDGETVPIGGTFSNGLQNPGEPNCRCTLTYAVSGEARPVDEGPRP